MRRLQVNIVRLHKYGQPIRFAVYGQLKAHNNAKWIPLEAIEIRGGDPSDARHLAFGFSRMLEAKYHPDKAAGPTPIEHGDSPEHIAKIYRSLRVTKINRSR